MSQAEEGSALLTVAVDGLEAEGPSVYISVYTDADSWLGDTVVARGRVNPAEGSFSTAITLPPGRYAFTAYLDVNGNGKLDSNFIGIPKEPVALSNNAKARFGPPRFDDAVFELSAEGVTQTIRLAVPE
ncbi:DUF2141 domain-containing protein [Parahaliea maris]|uniref:DUF2141 domain-containing protein n=1 Tax=Parahaliea maris TaxID=2716870 RepID=UPI001BB3CBB3|nr:DUF2141 domain-containing protein [Parahaliea maris]